MSQNLRAKTGMKFGPKIASIFGVEKEVKKGKPVTFKHFMRRGVNQGSFGDTPENDFAVDALADTHFRDFDQWQELGAYLVFHKAIPEAIEAARNLFTMWQES